MFAVIVFQEVNSSVDFSFLSFNSNDGTRNIVNGVDLVDTYIEQSDDDDDSKNDPKDESNAGIELIASGFGAQ